MLLSILWMETRWIENDDAMKYIIHGYNKPLIAKHQSTGAGQYNNQRCNM